MADRSRTSQRQQMAPGTLAVFKAAGHQFGAPASLWWVFSRFGARLALDLAPFQWQSGQSSEPQDVNAL